MGTTLTRVKLYPDGGASYGIDGVRGTIGVKKSMFKDGVAPETLVVEGDVFAAPGTGGSRRVSDPERAQKIREAAEKAQARAEKAAERAQKAIARAKKLGVAAPEAPAEQPQA